VSGGDDQPDVLVRVLQGEPSQEELAALVVLVAGGGVTSSPEPPKVASRSQWGAPVRRLRGIHRHGPGAWRASAWPR
jgi:hypothetical protein